MSSIHLHQSGAQYTFWGAKIPLIEVWSRDLFFWRDTKINSTCYCRFVLSCQIWFKKKVFLCPYRKENHENCYESLQCIACCHVLKIPLKDQNPTIMLFGCDGTYLLVEKTSRDYQKTISVYEEEPSSRQSHSVETEPVAKGKNRSFFGIFVSILPWLIQLTENSFPLSLFTLLACSKATWFSQSSTTVLSGLAVLDRI